MKRQFKSNVDVFNRDITDNFGYLYTTNAKLSSQMANRRITDVTLAITDFHGRRILDIGCGDGTYTLELYDRGQPSWIHGIDLSNKAISIARQKTKDRNITFAVHSAGKLPYDSNSFDIAYLRGVLHHVERPVDVLKEALRVAPILVVIEPNGFNPVLKLLEKYSRYHVEHDEKSYTSLTWDRWISRLEGKVHTRMWAGLVPMFCPDWLARLLRLIEPVIEKLPLMNVLGCAVYVFVASHEDRHVKVRSSAL